MDFFQFSPYPAHPIEGYFDLKLVLLSYFVAIFASYVALSIAGNLRSPLSNKMNYWIWFISGALVMGMGIWTMHFIGMEAFVTYMPIDYDNFLTILSLIIAIVASGFALFWILPQKVSFNLILLGGVLMGIGIASMHYVGMAAMNHVNIRYIPSLFFLSILIAIVASLAALWLMIKTNDFTWGATFNILSAIVMGTAICGMHYMGMAAAVMTTDGNPLVMEANSYNAGLPPTYIGASAALIMLIFLALLSNYQRSIMLLQRSNEDLLAKEIELVEARKRAEDANVAKSYFLANMSHEIRTPLNVIVGTASLLSRSPLEGNERKHIDRISIASQILLNLIMDILDFSKIEAKELKLNLIKFDFMSIVKEVVNLTKEQAEKKNLDIFINYPLDKPLNIVSDPVRVQQVITNLLANAIKFTKEGYIKINIIPQKVINGHLRIRLEVEDTGIGISEDNFESIFQKFSQVDNSSTRKYGGTGLGLAITKELVTLMGGEIGVKSKLNEGTTFWFEIPFLIDKNHTQNWKT